jgi:peptidoglycan/LPS O-acetylase OafA/YrhL
VIARGVDRRAVGGGCLLGTALLVLCVVLAEDAPPVALLRLALVPLAAVAAFVLDESAAAAVDAVPRTLRRRTVNRAVVLGLPLLLWAAGIAVVELRTPATPATGLLVEGTGVLAITLALAAVLRWGGRAEPGEVAASAVGGAILALVVFDVPSWWPVPIFPGDTGWSASTVLWGLVAVASAMVVAGASREPYRLSR